MSKYNLVLLNFYGPNETELNIHLEIKCKMYDRKCNRLEEKRF